MTRPVSGARITSQRARLRVVAQLVCIHGIALALVTGVPAIVAALDGEVALALWLGAAALLPLAGFLFQRRQSPLEEPRRIEGLVAMAAAFLLASALAAPAFVTLGMDPVPAFFEAVSGITTTGLSVAVDTASWPDSAHFLRAWLQWSGGLAFAAMAIALVVGRGIVALRLGLAEKPGETVLSSTRTRARSVLGAYLIASLLAVLVAVALAARPLEGALLALAAISTGGFAPAEDSLGTVGPALQAAIAAVIVAGAISMTLFARAWREGFAVLYADAELSAMLAICAAMAVGVVIVEAVRPGGVGVWDSVFFALSAQSTAGFSTVDTARLAPASIALLCGAMAIGGSLGSTAGGLKVFRAAFAAAAARTALTRTALSPNAVTRLRVFGQPAEPHEMTTVFALFILFVGGVAVLWFSLLLAGCPALPALFDSISAFATVGLSAGAIDAGLPKPAMIAVTIAMLLGRLEFLAFLALMRPRTWIN